MRFPILFRRYKTGGSPDLGTDDVPTVTPTLLAVKDCLLTSRPKDVGGSPVQRVAIGYTYAGGGSGIDLTADAYMWEDASQAWYKLTTTPVALKVGEFAFVDTVIPAPPPPLSRDLLAHEDRASTTPGNLEIYLVVSDEGGLAADGTYTFVMAPDVTGKGV